MRISKTVLDWIIRHERNPLVIVAATLLAGDGVLMAVWEQNRGKRNFFSSTGKKAALTISFDCDYPRDVEAMPQILKMFARYEMKTSFALVGHWLEQYPDEHKLVRDYGHEMVNHTYSHPDNPILNPGRKFRTISREEKKEEVTRCHDACLKILGCAPSGFRIPHFKNLFTPDIYGILEDVGYRYSSSTWITNTRSNGMPFMATGKIIEFPLTTCPQHPFTVFDTWHSLNSAHPFYRMIHKTPQQYCTLFRRLIDAAIVTNSYLNIYIDPYDITQIPGFAEVLAYAHERRSELWIATYQQIIADAFPEGRERNNVS